MRIVVIGGTGFIGQYLVNELQKDKKNKIIILSRNPQRYNYFKLDNFSNVDLINGIDITNSRELEKYFKNADIVFNLSGLVSFKRKDKKRLILTNHLGVLNILNACEKSNVKKFIHLSSTAALGFGKEILDENSDFNWHKYPKCIYSISKYLSNKDILKSKCNSTVIYPSLVLGPGDLNNTLKLIKSFKNKIILTPPGTNSIIDVRDLVKALVLIMNKKTNENSFILSGGNYSFNYLNELILKELNKKSLNIKLPKFSLYLLLFITKIYEYFSKNPKVTYENVFLSFKKRNHKNNRISKLGFSPKYPIEETIRDSIKWIKQENL